MNREEWARIDELFDAALDLEPKSRAAFLDQACGENAALRKEIESLLAADEKTRSFIEQPALKIAAQFQTEIPARLKPGDCLGPYKILSKLGAGGMGEVYRASDPRIGRNVAIKVLSHSFSQDADRLKRFEQEARVAGTLNHPNILTIYDAGIENEYPYLVYELLEGETLRDRMASDLPVEKVIEYAVQLAQGLAAAHEKGIIHRDLKPENIMITPSDQAKVLDFGLAKFNNTPFSETAGETTNRTKTEPGLLFGTVQYMSPEQALLKDLDHRSDIFSFGTVLYEMVTGKLPFAAKGTTQVLDRIIHAPCDPISQSGKQVPAELERIIEKCLEKDPGQRYASIQDLLFDLRNLQQHGGSVASASRFRIRVFVRRHASLLLFPVLAVLLLVVGIMFYPRPARSRSIRSIAILPLLNLSDGQDSDYLSDGITEGMIDNLSQVQGLRVMAPGTVFTYKGKTVDPRRLGHELRVDAVVTGSVRQQGEMLIIEASLADAADGHQIWGHQYTRKLSDMLVMQSEISSELTNQLRAQLTPGERERVTTQHTSNSEAHQLYLKGRYFANKKTNDGHKYAIKYYKQALEKDPSYALAYAGLSDAYAMADEIDPKYVEHSDEAAIKAVQLDDNLAEAHVSYAGMKSWRWDWEGEEKQYQRALALNPNLANAHVQYGDLLAAKGEVDRAVFETGLALQLDPLSLHYNAQMGVKLTLARRYDEALKQLEKTVEMDPDFAMSHWALESTYLCKGMYREAIEEDKKAQRRRAAKSSDSIAANSAALLAAYSAFGSEGYWEKRLELEQENSNPEPLELALDYAQLRKLNEAFQWLEVAYARHDYWLIFENYIKSNPLWDPLRADPRYTNLLQRCRLL